MKNIHTNKIARNLWFISSPNYLNSTDTDRVIILSSERGHCWQADNTTLTAVLSLTLAYYKPLIIQPTLSEM